MTRGAGRKNRTSGVFGSVDRLATGYRARYYGPDGRRHKAPTLFLTKAEARGWLALRHAEIIRKAWEPPDEPRTSARLTFAVYADEWMTHRELKDRTRDHYRKLLDNYLIPAFGVLPLASVTPDDVRRWYSRFDPGKPTMRAHCYGLLRTIYSTAASDGKVPTTPCVLRGAGTAKRVHLIRPATLDELEKLTNAMPERYRLMVLLASWCAMRFGELAELRRGDIDLSQEVIHITRGVVRVGGKTIVGTPKTDAGIRDVAIPPHLLPAIEDHLAKHVGQRRDSMLFPIEDGGHLTPGTLHHRFKVAREAADRPDLRFHDLRHSGAVLAAATGATLAELMARLGHSSPAAAMRYQHAAKGRDREIAALLSKLANG
jgi:integrase